MAIPTDREIRRLDASVAKYSDFADTMTSNHPVILYNFEGLLPSFKRWQKQGKADVDFLRGAFGNMVVPVVECSSEGYGEQRQMSMTLLEYLDAVHGGRQDGDGDSTQSDGSQEASGGAGLYLKDWHFQRLRRDGGRDSGDGENVETPFFFADDWLNWWCDKQGQEDYRFVYIGPRGSWTPLHHDVLNRRGSNDYSWSFNVCGAKHWTLFPKEVTPFLYDRHGRNLATDVRKDFLDPENFPELEGAPRLEVVQAPGEAIFVPSGWHHQVVNLGDGGLHGGLTISVNNNWFNGFNLDSVRSFLSSELEAVRAALEHLRQDMLGEGEWERQCELAMRTNSGLNVTDFASIVVARAIFLLSDEKRSRGTGATVERTGWASITGESESDFRESRGDSGGGDRGVWHEERWKVFALEKIAAALRDLSTAPFVNHVFLDDAGL
ncbi:unnamed protein product, partial [Ascophyllum nodosum]